ncbi:hypothetical protein EGU54_21980 [Achromobacter aegrifaciens]|nr:hypothetical protein EGU54_21980 [Achromobacter aegrifaciens]
MRRARVGCSGRIAVRRAAAGGGSARSPAGVSIINEGAVMSGSGSSTGAATETAAGAGTAGGITPIAAASAAAVRGLACASIARPSSTAAQKAAR